MKQENELSRMNKAETNIVNNNTINVIQMEETEIMTNETNKQIIQIKSTDQISGLLFHNDKETTNIEQKQHMNEIQRERREQNEHDFEQIRHESIQQLQKQIEQMKQQINEMKRDSQQNREMLEQILKILREKK